MLLSHRCSNCLLLLLAVFVIATERDAVAEWQSQVPWPQVASIPAPVMDFRSATAYPVIQVIGTDRLVVLINQTETTIRFSGVDRIDTGEDPPEEADAFETVTNRFIDDLLRGESVYLEKLEVREGDMKAYVFRAPDGLFVDAELIRQGLAHAPASSNPPFAELFHYCQQRARENQKGFWKHSTTDARIENPPTPLQPQQPVVYVESSGSKYHAAGCPALHDKPIPIVLYKAITGFEWCPRCKPAR